jgi:hypothetical protein
LLSFIFDIFYSSLRNNRAYCILSLKIETCAGDLSKIVVNHPENVRPLPIGKAGRKDGGTTEEFTSNIDSAPPYQILHKKSRRLLPIGRDRIVLPAFPILAQSEF